MRCAELAQRAGYDGVEIMGSEGYLINQFIAPQTNHRDDEWGGSFLHRMRFPVEIVRRTRAAVGPNFIIIYRLSMLDLVEGGSTWDEVVALAQAVEAAGATIINTGIGWHEARIPTIATMVPRAAFAWVTRRLKSGGEDSADHHQPHQRSCDRRGRARARRCRHGVDGAAVSRRRGVRQQGGAGSRRGNQYLHRLQPGVPRSDLSAQDGHVPGQSLRVPRDRTQGRTGERRRRKIAVVGAGPAGMACAVTAAERGHAVTLFEAAAEIGGQFNLARRIPGKEEFAETLRYFRVRLALLGVKVELNSARRCGRSAWLRRGDSRHRHRPAHAVDSGHRPSEGCELYVEIVDGRKQAGKRVALIGAGGIGFDVAELLSATDPPDGHASDGRADDPAVAEFAAEWGIDMDFHHRGGLMPAHDPPPARQLWLLQRKAEKVGAGLAKTTGWIRRTLLKKRGVVMSGGVEYERIDDAGLHIKIDGQPQTLAVDTIVICAGQEPRRDLYADLLAAGVACKLIGGADVALELDARRAIDQGTRVALNL